MAQYRAEGVVVRTYRLGEADRIVVLATLEHGKVRAVAKGIRRTTSKVGARLEPLSHVSLLMWRGRNLDIVNQVEVIEAFRAVRENLGKVSAASAMAEVADRIFQEATAYPDMFTMLVRALRTLEVSDSPMIVPAFFLRALVLEGVAPVLDRCAHCGAGGPFVSFDPGEGGVLCRACRRGTASSADALEVMRRVVSGSLREVLAQEIPAAVVGEVRHLATEAMEHHVEARLKSVPLLEKV